MYTMLILFIHGFSGAGKDTLGKCFTDHFGFKRVAFADALKMHVSTTHNVSLEILHSQDGKRQICPHTGTTWRDILISEASLCRAVDPDIFAKISCAAIADNDNIVITDWRYPNEYDVVRTTFPDATIYTVLIKREHGSGCSPVYHDSEYLLINHKPNFIILNDGKRNLLQGAEHILSNCLG